MTFLIDYFFYSNPILSNSNNCRDINLKYYAYILIVLSIVK